MANWFVRLADSIRHSCSTPATLAEDNDFDGGAIEEPAPPSPQSSQGYCDLIETNLAVVANHIENEARDPACVMPLYTEDVVLEIPTRGLKFEGKPAIEANYRRMFSALEDVSLEHLDRFATETRVVDDMIARFKLVGEGMDNAPIPIGSRVALRLVHVFHMRDGLIEREIVHEQWKLDES